MVGLFHQKEHFGCPSPQNNWAFRISNKIPSPPPKTQTRSTRSFTGSNDFTAVWIFCCGPSNQWSSNSWTLRSWLSCHPGHMVPMILEQPEICKRYTQKTTIKQNMLVVFQSYFEQNNVFLWSSVLLSYIQQNRMICFFKHAFCSYIIATINSHVHQWRKTTHSKFRSNSKRLCLFRVQRQAHYECLELGRVAVVVSSAVWDLEPKNGMFGELLAKPIGNRIQVNLSQQMKSPMNLQVLLESHPPYLVSNFHTKRSKHSTQGSCLENFKRPRTNLLNVSYLKMFNSLTQNLR